MKFFILSLGSNLGNRLTQIIHAINMMPVEISNVSHIYRTEPLLLPNSPLSWNAEFLNIIISVWTDLCPHRLLKKIHKIEKIFNRERQHKWSPRTIDIDIIFYKQNSIIFESNLKIPHPLAHLRPFIMIPVCDIYPSLTHPTLNKKAHELASTIDSSSLTIFINKKTIMNLLLFQKTNIQIS